MSNHLTYIYSLGLPEDNSWYNLIAYTGVKPTVPIVIGELPFQPDVCMMDEDMPDKLRQIMLLAKMGRHFRTVNSAFASNTQTKLIRFRVRFRVNQEGDLLEFLDA
jgi:hypothetical protein